MVISIATRPPLKRDSPLFNFIAIISIGEPGGCRNRTTLAVKSAVLIGRYSSSPEKGSIVTSYSPHNACPPVDACALGETSGEVTSELPEQATRISPIAHAIAQMAVKRLSMMSKPPDFSRLRRQIGYHFFLELYRNMVFTRFDS